MNETIQEIFQRGYDGCRAMTRQWLRAMANTGDIVPGYETVSVTAHDKSGRIQSTKKVVTPDRPVDKNGSAREFIRVAIIACTQNYVDPDSGEAVVDYGLLDSGMVWEILAPELKTATFARLKSLAAEPDFKKFCGHLDRLAGVYIKGGRQTKPLMEKAGPAMTRHIDRLNAASAKLEVA